MIMLYHATFLSTILHPELRPRPFVFPYQVGASMLLAISAYFGCVTVRSPSLLRYCFKRMARMLPAFAVAVVVIFVILRAFPAPGWFDPTPDDLGANLLMLWNWSPEVPLVDPSHWTVPLQFMGSVMTALVYRSRWGRGGRIPIVLWGGVLLPIVQWPLRASDPPDWYRTLVDGFGLHRWHLFVAGAAIWLWSTKRMRTPQFVALVALCTAAQALHTSTPTPYGPITNWDLTVPVAIGLFVLAWVARGSECSGWSDWFGSDNVRPMWTTRAIQWYAGISYGVFLMHQSLGYLAMRWLNDIGLDPGVQTVGMLATGVLLGYLLTRTVERPAYRLLVHAFDRWAYRNEPKQLPSRRRHPGLGLMVESPVSGSRNHVAARYFQTVRGC
jgi:peptidoglycan/LPS O-acetylase OafA/YrhL